METQRGLCVELNPLMACLKFKLPYEGGVGPLGETDYVQGQLFSPPFLRCNSSEGTLICDMLDINSPLITYSHDHYNDTMFTFNTVVKVPDGQGMYPTDINKTASGVTAGNKYFKGTDDRINAKPNIAYVDVGLLGECISERAEINYAIARNADLNTADGVVKLGNFLYPSVSGRVFNVFEEAFKNPYEKSIISNNSDPADN